MLPNTEIITLRDDVLQRSENAFFDEISRFYDDFSSAVANSIVSVMDNERCANDGELNDLLTLYDTFTPKAVKQVMSEVFAMAQREFRAKLNDLAQNALKEDTLNEFCKQI